jgi:hypothetical protein
MALSCTLPCTLTPDARSLLIVGGTFVLREATFIICHRMIIPAIGLSARARHRECPPPDHLHHRVRRHPNIHQAMIHLATRMRARVTMSPVVAGATSSACGDGGPMYREPVNGSCRSSLPLSGATVGGFGLGALPPPAARLKLLLERPVFGIKRPSSNAWGIRGSCGRDVPIASPGRRRGGARFASRRCRDWV